MKHPERTQADMKFTYQFPLDAAQHWEPWIGRHNLTEIAVAAECSGFDAVSSTDHPFPPGDWLSTGGHHALDPFVALSFMAAATTRIQLVTLVLVAGYRNPYMTAKATSSLDRLSNGRLVVGIGAGYLRPEFDVVGGSFADRGKRLDEAIVAMRRAWSGEPIDHAGPHFPAYGHSMLPRPSQNPYPPVWVGGNSRAARRRVVHLADGWIPFEQTAASAERTGSPQLDFDSLGGQIAEISEAREAAGRPKAFDVCFIPRMRGNIDRVAESLENDVVALATAGVTHVSITSRAKNMDACLAEIESLGKLVVGPHTSCTR